MRLLFILTLFFNVCIINAQQLFYQNTFKGGVCGDGKSYVDVSYIFQDTINFENIVPPSSIIKSSFLILHKNNSYFGQIPKKDFIYTLILNDSIVIIDSTCEITPSFLNCYNSNNTLQKICAKDVTKYVKHNNNKLVRPNQPAVDLDYVYNGIYLIIIYEDLSMSTTNFSCFLNNQNTDQNTNHLLNTLNTISNTQDVGLSIWTEFAYSNYPINFEINSSLGNFNLGSLQEKTNLLTGVPSGKLACSFNYKSNIFYGLSDDLPDAFIDSTDAIANIKNYIQNNSSSIILKSNSNPQTNPCSGIINSFFLAYSTPCPARGFNDTIVKHTICQGQSLSLNTQSTGNTYSWYPAKGLSNANSATPIASQATTTNYIVSIDSAGCKHTEQVQVAVTPIPQADTIFASNNVCGGPSGSIIIKPGHGPYEPYIYSLNSAVGVSDTSFTNLSGGNYNVLITDTRGCTWQSSNFIIKDTIMVNAIAYAFPTSGVAPFTTQLLATATTGANNYNWYINNQYTSNAWYYNQTFNDSGVYNITLIAYNNIPTCADTTTLTIIVLPQDTAGIFIPNVFSPNGDGANDNYEIKIKNATLETFEMYDRWGVLVSTALDLTKTGVTSYSWSGRTTSGIECSAGTYFYVIKVKLDSAYSKEGTKEYKGFVTLVR
jgi:gliding motility-associated-like protein